MRAFPGISGRFSNALTSLSVIIAIIALLPEPGLALAPESPLAGRLVEEWTSSRGLPSDMAICMAQTTDGYLWIGTQRGLVRSDGLRLETLLPDPIYDLCAGKDGALWICQGSRLLRYQHGRFVPTLRALDSAQLAMNRVFEDMKGDLWIGLRNGRLGRLKNGIFSQFPLSGNKEFSVVTAIKEDARGILWIGTMTGGLYKGRDGVFSPYDVGLPPDYAVFHLRESRDGALWAATNLGLVRIREDRAAVLSPKNGLSSIYILDFLEDADGNMWVATPQGLNLLRRTGAEDFKAVPVGPSEQVLEFIFEDREKNIWISYSRRGLKCFQKALFRTLAEESGIPSYTSTVLVGRDGTVWIGDNVGCLHRMKNGRAELYLNLGFSPEAGIIAMAEDSRGRIWLGTLRSGVFVVENGKPVPLAVDKPLRAVRTILDDRRGGIWIGCSNGLACFRDGALKIYTTADGLPGNWISHVLLDRAGRLWIATNGGLAVRSLADSGRNDVLTVLLRQVVMTLFEDEDRVLWAGTLEGGLFRIRDGTITSCGAKQGLGSSTIYQIQDDGAGNLWLSSPAGVIKVAKASWPEDSSGANREIEATVYGKSDGARGELGNYSTGNSIARRPDGELWFALDDGISIINPRKIAVNKFLPNPVITRILFERSEVPLDRSKVVFKGVRSVRFEFAAPSFISPSRVKMRFRLEGFDTEWSTVKAAGKRFAEYANLPSGFYRFRVAACNSDNIWNENEAVFDFTLKPILHQTGLFKAGAAALALALSLLAYFGLQKFVKQQRAKRKYRYSTLEPGKAEECEANLIRLFEKEKVFTSPSLSLASLAKRLRISTKDLSRVINERFNRNFWALVNSYRIEEAKDRLAKATNGDQTVLRIALDVGFNSLAAFNRAFKKFVRMTPSEFRKANKINGNRP